MPKLTQQPEVSETLLNDCELRPEVRQRLEALLDTYAALTADRDMLAEQAELEKSKIGKLLNDYGYEKVGTNSHSLTWVRGAKNPARLDKLKLIAQGVTQKQIDAATVGGGTKQPYFQIRPKNGSGNGPVDEG